MTISPLLDLEDLASEERPSAWAKVIRENHFAVDVTFKNHRRPTGKMAFARFGDTRISAVSSVTQFHERSQNLIAEDADHLFAVVQIEGQLTVNQSGREKTLRPGSFAVYDAALPYAAAFPDEEYKLFCIQVPRTRFERALGAEADYTNLVLGEAKGGTVIAGYFREFARKFVTLPDGHRVRMLEHGIDVMIEALAGRRHDFE